MYLKHKKYFQRMSIDMSLPSQRRQVGLGDFLLAIFFAQKRELAHSVSTFSRSISKRVAPIENGLKSFLNVMIRSFLFFIAAMMLTNIGTNN